MFKTEYEFTLPKGYVDEEGNLHKKGVMRLANAGDEILPQKDPRVKNNPSYLVVILLSRVITKLGEITQITPQTVEGLFSADLAYLQDFYQTINDSGSFTFKATCPQCGHKFEQEVDSSGEE
jgi:hypothetical protein